MNASTNATIAELLSTAADENNGSYGNLTYLSFNAALAVLTIDPRTTRIDALIYSILGDLLSPKTYAVEQLCTFPISGSYGFLNRLLYYRLLLFSILVQDSTWLCPAALGVAMSYSVGACVRAFVLIS